MKTPILARHLEQQLLPTSTAGSLPKPSWLAKPEALWSPWKLQGEELAEGKRDALLVSLQLQQQGLSDVSVHVSLPYCRELVVAPRA